MQMEVLFGYQDFKEIIEEDFTELKAMIVFSKVEQKILKKSLKKDCKVLFYIF